MLSEPPLNEAKHVIGRDILGYLANLREFSPPLPMWVSQNTRCPTQFRSTGRTYLPGCPHVPDFRGNFGC